MSAHLKGQKPASKERFRLEFQQRLREYMARNGSATEGFTTVWARTIAEFELQESQQADVYWELLQWARSYDLFTCTEPKPPLNPGRA